MAFCPIAGQSYWCLSQVMVQSSLSVTQGSSAHHIFAKITLRSCLRSTEWAPAVVKQRFMREDQMNAATPKNGTAECQQAQTITNALPLCLLNSNLFDLGRCCCGLYVLSSVIRIFSLLWRRMCSDLMGRAGQTRNLPEQKKKKNQSVLWF